MTISWLQAAALGLFACLCSNSCMAGQAVGNYTIGRPLVGGLVCGIILGNNCVWCRDAVGLHRVGDTRRHSVS
jgi:mannose/fructose/N-acetylgalactosamine-specific phosphotransferase system component IIC